MKIKYRSKDTYMIGGAFVRVHLSREINIPFRLLAGAIIGSTIAATVPFVHMSLTAGPLIQLLLFEKFTSYVKRKLLRRKIA